MSGINLSTPLSLYSIPVMWFSSFYPMTMKYLLIDKAAGYNNVQPRANTSRILDKVPKEIVERAQRMEGAHLNGNEALPLWSAAVIAGNLAGLSHELLNIVSITYIGARFLYNYVYINQKTEAQSQLRSGIFFASLSLPLFILIKSANVIRARGSF